MSLRSLGPAVQRRIENSALSDACCGVTPKFSCERFYHNAYYAASENKRQRGSQPFSTSTTSERIFKAAALQIISSQLVTMVFGDRLQE
jgi:hypothetical protein